MRTIELRDGVVRMIDQRKLPKQLVVAEIRDYGTVARAIKEMWIRVAPAIGAAAAFGLALAALESEAATRDELLRELETAAQTLNAARPTAANLNWALRRVMKKARAANLPVGALRELVVN